jgi:hypothetical protein
MAIPSSPLKISSNGLLIAALMAALSTATLMSPSRSSGAPHDWQVTGAEGDHPFCKEQATEKRGHRAEGTALVPEAAGWAVGSAVFEAGGGRSAGESQQATLHQMSTDAAVPASHGSRRKPALSQGSDCS